MTETGMVNRDLSGVLGLLFEPHDRLISLAQHLDVS